MARFVKIGNHYVNQEQIVQVFPALETNGQPAITVGLSNMSIMHLEGHEREAFLLWLDNHVGQWGADALALLADHIRAEQEAAGVGAAIDDVLNDIPF